MVSDILVWLVQGLLPSRARLILAGKDWQEVPAEAVSPGDLLAVLPGDRVPVDGCVISGCTTIDESALTGEAMPVGKSAGRALVRRTMRVYLACAARREAYSIACLMNCHLCDQQPPSMGVFSSLSSRPVGMFGLGPAFVCLRA